MNEVSKKNRSEETVNPGDYEKHLMIGGGTRGGPVLDHGKGVRVWDTSGKEYIDCTSQSWALYLGYCNDEIWEAVNAQAKNLTHVHQGFDTSARFKLAKKLADLAPEGLNRVSFTPSSGLAIEGALKIALKNRPGSASFLALMDGYHGTTLGTMGASWISTQSNGGFVGGSRFLPLTQQFIRVPTPFCFRQDFNEEDAVQFSLKMLELTITKGVNGPAAGFIIEPIQASGGQIPLPVAYVKGIREICDRYEIPLIFDEIQTYMRIGTMFAADYYDVIPDIIVLGKAIGGGLPLGATIIHDKLEGFKPDAEELHTFANASLSHVAALKQIEIVERDNLLNHANEMGAYLYEGLERFRKEYPEMEEIRQVGIHIGVELSANSKEREPLFKETSAIRDAGLERGIIFGLAGVRKNLLKIKPPLIVTKEECDEILHIFGACLKAVLRS